MRLTHAMPVQGAGSLGRTGLARLQGTRPTPPFPADLLRPVSRCRQRSETRDHRCLSSTPTEVGSGHTGVVATRPGLGRPPDGPSRALCG